MKAFKRTMLNTKGFGHVELILIIVVIVALVGVGGLVYSKHNKAHASSWQAITSSNGGGDLVPSWPSSAGVKASACVTPVYYGVWDVGTLAILPYGVNPSSSGVNGTATVQYTGGSVTIGSGESWWYGVAQSYSKDLLMTASQFNSARLVYSVHSSTGDQNFYINLNTITARC
jgi:hypothetical protein